VSSSTTDAALVDVTMPQMGVSVTEGTVVAWQRQVGEQIRADETICAISTDKIDSDVPSPATGTLVEILVEPEETVAVGTVLARIATGTPDRGEAPSPAGPNGAGARTGPGYSPVVSRIAAEHGVDLSTVEGTGRGGRVRKQDVLAAVENRPLHIESPYRPEPEPAGPQQAPQPEPPQPEPAEPPAPEGATLSRMRRSIGAHMKRSLETAATCTTWMEADMTRVEAARRARGLTALPIVARCVVDALAERPALNATLDGERYRQHADVHLGIAVSLGDEGLVVPVIRSAQELSPEGLAARVKELARRAREGELTPDDVRGGTFTITNPGQFGSLMATPVINQPQVAILDLEAIVKRPVVVSGQDGGDVIAIRSQTILGLSWDHRALDGAEAARFLGAVRRRLEGWDG
jgi:pyruvate/2-oxoglutarate dehydrogenase complex dihydrolipoamide acyltransferase (E2) component